MQRPRLDGLTAWLDRHRAAVLLVALAVALGCAAVASRLSLTSDLTSLLPPSQRSVRDLEQVRGRARPFGTVQLLVEADTAARCARASELLAARLEALPAGLVAQFARDDGPRARYAWDHRFLLAELDDLVAARDALAERIRRGKLEANPLFISLDDDEPPPAKDRLAELEERLAVLERDAKAPPQRVSADGRARLLSLQTAFSGSDAGRAGALLGRIKAAIAEVRAEAGPGVEVGLTGNVTLTTAEHDSVLEGMALSLGITLALCGLALVWYYRSGALVLAILGALGVGVAATFAAAWALVGHLNVMTAFLFAIVVGNGVNASLILVARFLEELRAGDDHRAALAAALRGALPGTLGAAATAAVAYASLVATDFRGFRQFGAIGGIGMGLTWLTTFTVLPAALLVLARRGWIRRSSPPGLGAWLARAYPRRDGAPLVVAGLVTLAAAAITVAYVARDPFTRDWRDLQSSTPAIERANAVSARIRARLPARAELNGQAYQVVFAVERRDQAAALAAHLRGVDADRPAARRWVRDVYGLDDVLPARQPEKLAVLAEIRALLDGPALAAAVSDDERARLAKVRPPDDLRPVTDADVPPELAWPFTERDGTRGRLIVLRGATRLDSFDVRHRLEFAREVRRLALPPGAVAAGEAMIVADLIETMERDAPGMVAFALLGSVLAVLLVIGLRRHGLVTLACGLAGVVVMIAACAVAGLRVHFLDLIALPITVGIGIDYAVNLAARDRQDGARGPRYLLETTGGTVLLCSYTTAVGYGTLLLSANGGIRAFGLAALLGEVACVLVALFATPAWLAVLRRHDAAKRSTP